MKPGDGNSATLTIPTRLLGGLLSAPARLVVRADIYLDAGTILATEIVQENRLDGRMIIQPRLSGIGLISAPIVNISGILEPERGLTFENDLNLLRGSIFQATVGLGNLTSEIRIPGSIRIDGAFLLVDEIVGIAVGAPEYVEWPLFRLATHLEWSISGITEGYFDTVEDRRASGDGITVVLRKILPPAETKILIPIADRDVAPTISPLPPPVPEGGPPILPPIGQPTIAPFLFVPVLSPTPVGADAVVEGTPPVAIVIPVLLALCAVGLFAFFVVKWWRNRITTQFASAEAPLETRSSVPTASEDPEPGIELSEA
jgi:hypothetical protein